MLMNHCGDIIFFDYCPMCTRKFTAASLLVLNVKIDEHLEKCKPQMLKHRLAIIADRAQGKLF